jgi:DNA-binding CsgD family transcriptional regulator
LEQATAHGMIEEASSQPLAYRFTHELVRRALYDRMPGLRRAELHLQVAEALERARAAGDNRGLAELAHHFGAAAPIDGPKRAIGYSLLAGRAALATLDFEEAESRFGYALELGIDDPRERAETQLELGTARFRAGRSDAALLAFGAAAEIARQLGDARLLMTAAIGFEEACWRPGITDEGAVELLEEAAVAFGDDDDQLLVMLLSGLCRAQAFSGNYGASAAAEQRALAMARRLGDRRGLATVLVRSYWSHPEHRGKEMLAMMDEAGQIAESLGDGQLMVDVLVWEGAGLINMGELRSAQGAVAKLRELATRQRQPFTRHVAEHYASLLALCFGRLADAETMALASHEWGRVLTGRAASGVHGIQMFSIRREQGRLAELAAATRVFARSDQASAAWRPGFAALLSELGMEDEARRELARVRDRGLDELRTRIWLASLTYLTDACAAVGDEETAALVYPELAPFAGANVVIGSGVVCYGAADRYLGLLATTLGDHAQAIEHFERALAFNRAMGADTWTAHTLYGYGRTLRMRGGAADAARASSLLSEAATLAERIGMPVLLARAQALGARIERSPALPDHLSGREVEILRLVAAGRSNREIGEELYISGHTVANHVRSILRKTGAANRTEAAAYAVRNALLDSPDSR